MTPRLRGLALAALAVGARPPARAIAAAPKANLVDIEDEVMCVTCKVPLNIAEGDQPDSERARIRELIAAGKTKEQIKRVLVVEYGEQVLALPDKSGFGITAYVIPLALLAAVLAALALLVPRWRQRPAAGIANRGAAGAGASAGTNTPELSDEDAKRLDDDLGRYD
ncbi:MAG: cytochrome c-type biosis protein CcmH [Solirubrobacteraceae bacterium]|nr:cytochrome c-type biosis protein CcmH [Solirubrobacteraceae bacterium]